MSKRRIKKSVIKKGIIIISILLAVLIISKTISTIRYHKTNEYKLKQVGYNINEIRVIEKISEENITKLLNSEYNEFVDDMIKEKYYLDKNLERYIDYKKKNNNTDIKDVISLVNVGRDNEFYTNTKKTDIEKKELMLVNKYNYLEETYTPENIIDISIRYAYDDNKTTEEALEYYKIMNEAALKDGIKLVISSGYRTYKEQEETYEYYKEIKGEENIESYAARPGFSEHQTGLAFDILKLGVKSADFDKTEEFTWLENNSYKYGFILRYPKDKENITGYDYESWHYRYVGVTAATKMHNENITFDEYYAYYIDK